VLAIALSVSGARAYLDASSPDAIPALGFVDGVLSWFSAACIPTLLFANGVWMCGRDMLCGGWRGQLKARAWSTGCKGAWCRLVCAAGVADAVVPHSTSPYVLALARTPRCGPCNTRRTPHRAQVLGILSLKLTMLPAFMVALTLVCGLRGESGLSLVLLASCPLAPLAFLVCQQYGHGAELATAVTIQGVLLMLPQMMAVIKVNQLGGLYDVNLVA
jgi:uncharacterized membrane protein YhdT